MYEVATPDGMLTLGRCCAAVVTGHRDVDREVARLARMTEVARRREQIRAEFPDLAATCNERVVGTLDEIVVTDVLWGSRQAWREQVRCLSQIGGSR